MHPSLLRQVLGIAVTDVKLRLRRTSTLWVILILSGLAYSVVPDPAGGRALMVVDDARAMYTSQVVALATAGLATLLLTFAGFYLTSNALRRDLLARTGSIIAATPVSSAAYLTGKFLGAAASLGLITAVYVLNVMAMHLLRGEGPLEPFTFIVTYLLALGPAIIVVSALAIAFECIPVLSGRVGDVLYFFIWMILLAAGAMGAQGGGSGRIWDVLGLGFILGQVHSVTGSEHLAIGMTPFDIRVPPWVLPRMSLTLAAALPRLLTALLAVPILLVGLLFFHRFDPARVRGASQAAGGHLIRRISLLLKPLTRLVSGAGERLVAVAPGPLRAIVAETVMTLCQSPLLLLAWLGVLGATVVAPGIKVQHVLPLAIAAILAIGLADLSTRDRAAGTLTMLYSMPGVKPGYAWIKLGAATLLGLLFCVPAAMRIAFTSPGSALSLVIAAGFMASLATALGLLTRTPKTFMGIFLLFVYLVLNGAQVPALDFAGWNGVATSGTRVGYLVATLMLAALAAAKHRWDMTRET